MYNVIEPDSLVSYGASCCSVVELVLVVQNVDGLSVFNLLRSLLQFQLEQSIADHTDSNINLADVSFDT